MESDSVIETGLRSLFDVGCTEYCRLKIMSDVFAALHCAELQKHMQMNRDRRAKLDLMNSDLFMPARGRRSGGDSSPPVTKKAKLDVLAGDLFVPHRGRRQMARKHFYRVDWFDAYPKRNGLDLNVNDFFVPHRGKRVKPIEDIFADNFFPQRGKKAQQQWLASNDRQMIDRQDLNQLLGIVNDDNDDDDDDNDNDDVEVSKRK